MGKARLGLRYGTVRLAPHSAMWARAFDMERARLAHALSRWGCEIEHVGSTAVPGLPAKPILDIAVAFPPAVPVAPLIAALTRLRYQYRGDFGSNGGHLFVREARPHVRTHHLHLVARDDPQWSAYLLFRELLRNSAAARRAYLREKRVLAARYARNREAYTDGKDDVVRRLLAAARRDG